VSAHRDLQCPNGCSPARFEALNAPLFVDSRGRYLDHDTRHATYVCATCASVAIDVAAAAREMARDRSAAPLTLICPACAAEMLPPEDDPLATHVECPACGVQFAIEEGLPRLHGGSAYVTEDD
jgi:DNA-directed RNA polymerase subunit RPC12/RpoP